VGRSGVGAAATAVPAYALYEALNNYRIARLQQSYSVRKRFYLPIICQGYFLLFPLHLTVKLLLIVLLRDTNMCQQYARPRNSLVAMYVIIVMAK